MTPPDDLVRLRHLRDAAEKAIAFSAGKARESLDEDELLRLALTKLVEIVGEAAKQVSEATRMELTFSDDLVRELDFASIPRGGVFAPLEDEAFVAEVAVDPTSGTICWPNGVDLDPDVLHGDFESTLLATCAHVMPKDDDRARAIVDATLGGSAEDWLRTQAC